MYQPKPKQSSQAAPVTSQQKLVASRHHYVTKIPVNSSSSLAGHHQTGTPSKHIMT